VYDILIAGQAIARKLTLITHSLLACPVCPSTIGTRDYTLTNGNLKPKFSLRDMAIELFDRASRYISTP
jgi:hypothetical protein